MGMTVRDIDAERAKFYKEQADDGVEKHVFMYPVATPTFVGKRKAAAGVEDEEDEMESTKQMRLPYQQNDVAEPPP